YTDRFLMTPSHSRSATGTIPGNAAHYLWIFRQPRDRAATGGLQTNRVPLDETGDVTAIGERAAFVLAGAARRSVSTARCRLAFFPRIAECRRPVLGCRHACMAYCRCELGDRDDARGGRDAGPVEQKQHVRAG